MIGPRCVARTSNIRAHSARVTGNLASSSKNTTPLALGGQDKVMRTFLAAAVPTRRTHFRVSTE